MQSTTVSRVLRFSLLGASLWYIGAYVAVALLRLGYPFDLEWMEGGSVDHVVRVLRHESLYVAPSISFIPYEYPPLYFYLSALLAKVVGVGYLPLRLVSLGSSLICLACIYHIVKGETGRSQAAIVAAGLFAATFRASGAWFDLARVDSLFLALFLLALVMLRASTSERGHLLVGVLLSLSFLTKQPALAMALPVVLYEMYVRPRLGLVLAVTLAAVVGVSTLLLHLATSGWYTFYVWAYPFKHAFISAVWTTFWTRDLFAVLPVPLAGGLVLIGVQLRQRRAGGLFWLAVSGGMVGAAFRSRLQAGGYDNVLMPAYAILSILLGLAIGASLDRLKGGSVRTRLAEASIYVLCLIQMAWLGYDPRTQVPRASDRASGEHLLGVLAATPGDVLLPYHGYLTTAAGKPSSAHLMQVFDILKVGDEQSAALAEQFRSAIRQRAFGAIVLDDTSTYFFMPDVDANYLLQTSVFSEAGVFLPVTGGVISRPQYVYVPRPSTPAEAGALAQERVQEALRRAGRAASSASAPMIK